MKRRIMMLPLIPMMVFGFMLISLFQTAGGEAAPPAQHVLRTRQQHVNAAASSNLIYHGGPVMAGVSKDYAIFWEPTGSYVSPTYNSLIERYFGDVGSSGLYHNNTQYTNSVGKAPTSSSLGGAWVDTSAYPGPTLSDAQIQHEATKAIKANGWTASIHNNFFVFTARNEVICTGSSSCSFTNWCAYHGAFGSTIYDAMPYVGTNLTACWAGGKSPNGDVDADATINVTSHEQMEAATDPHLNAWYDSSGYEIGDKCAWTFGHINTDGSNVSWNGHKYIVQREWDNHTNSCVLTGP
jgi:hypothetical protein